jgi:hypothetical protein
VLERTITDFDLQMFGEGEPSGEPSGEPNGLMNPGEPAPTAPGFHDRLPEDLRAHPSLQKFKDEAGLAKSYVELERFLGSEKVPIPKKDASPEDMDAFYNKLGRPESPDKYVFDDLLKNFGEVVDPTAIDKFKPLLHKAGLTQKMAEGVVGGYLEVEAEMLKEARASLEAELEQGRQSLLKDWGNAYNDKLKVASSALDATGIEGVWEWAQKTGIKDDPMFVRVMAHFGQGLGEDRLHQGANSGILTPESANKEYERLMADPDFKKLYIGGDKSAVKKVTELMEAIAGKELADMG